MKSKFLPYELASYAKKVNEFESLSLERELGLARQYKNGDSEAGQALIKANLRLSLKISRGYFYHGHNPLEIVQEGNMGLVKAITMFDPDRGLKFFSYAVWWVHAYIKNFVYKSSRGTLGFTSSLFPLDSVLSENSDESFIDLLPDEEADQEEAYFSKQRRVLLSQVLSSDSNLLTGREKYILTRRFFEEPRPSLAQVASKLNLTKERIRQLESSSLKVLRRHIEEQYALVVEDFAETSRARRAGNDKFTGLRASG